MEDPAGESREMAGDIGEDEADRTNPDDRDIVRVYANVVISLTMRRQFILLF